MSDKTSHSRTDSRYWKPKVTMSPSGEYAVQIYYQKKRHRFPLTTAKQNEAATKAAKIFTTITNEGWDAAIEQYKPHTLVKVTDPTFGKVFEAVKTVSSAKASTIADYTRSARGIISSIKKLDKKKKRFDSRKGRDEWVAKVDAVRLTAITPAEARKWRDKFINDRAEGNPNSKEGHSAKVSSNSLLRQARSLFGGGCLSKLKDMNISLPDPLPFHDSDEKQSPILSKIDRARLKYKSCIDFTKLVTDAREELGADPEKQNQWAGSSIKPTREYGKTGQKKEHFTINTLSFSGQRLHQTRKCVANDVFQVV